MKTILMFILCGLLAGVLSAQEGNRPLGVRPFRGTVTAVDSNGNYPGHCFTAIDAKGIIRVFHISSLKDLDVGKRVVLRYYESASYPLRVKTIRFLAPKKNTDAED